MFSHLAEQLSNALTYLRVPELRGNLGQWYQDKSSFCQARVRYGHIFGSHNLIVIEQDIDVDWAGSIGETGHSAHSGFDVFGQVEEFPGA